jgi:hypothetical protein
MSIFENQKTLFLQEYVTKRLDRHISKLILPDTIPNTDTLEGGCVHPEYHTHYLSQQHYYEPICDQGLFGRTTKHEEEWARLKTKGIFDSDQGFDPFRVGRWGEGNVVEEFYGVKITIGMLILYINENWQNTVLLVTKSVGKCKDEIDQLRTYLNESKIQNRAADQQDTLNKTLQKVVENHKTLLSHQQTQIEKTREDQSSLRRATVTDYKTLQKVVVQTITLLSSQQTQIDNQRQEIETLKQMFNIF